MTPTDIGSNITRTQVIAQTYQIRLYGFLLWDNDGISFINNITGLIHETPMVSWHGFLSRWLPLSLDRPLMYSPLVSGRSKDVAATGPCFSSCWTMASQTLVIYESAAGCFFPKANLHKIYSTKKISWNIGHRISGAENSTTPSLITTTKARATMYFIWCMACVCELWHFVSDNWINWYWWKSHPKHPNSEKLWPMKMCVLCIFWPFDPRT